MKIIKKGVLPTVSGTVYTGHCANCGCIFEQNAIELSTADTTAPVKNLVVSCPTDGCNAAVFMNEKW